MPAGSAPTPTAITPRRPMVSDKAPNGVEAAILTRWKKTQRSGMRDVATPNSPARRRRKASEELPRVNRRKMKR